MFTLKLFRRHPTDHSIQTKAVSVHSIGTNEIGVKNESGQYVAQELWAFQADGSYETYYVGEPTVGMIAYGRDDRHLDQGPHSWWGWGLLENSSGKTSEHYRPASYG